MELPDEDAYRRGQQSKPEQTPSATPGSNSTFMTNSPYMKLGIACVYFFRDEDAWLLETQLDFIEECTAGTDFHVYAAGNRLQPELKKQLIDRPFVKFIDLPDYSGDGGPEHGHYLGELLKVARADGCTHLCTLDCDSFPIRRGWPTYLAEKMGKHRVAAVFRAENRDVDLPHPCGTFMLSSVINDREFDFFPTPEQQATAEFQRYVSSTQKRIDTGSGLGFALWQANEAWLKLYRSNQTDLHFMMAGIYDDVFFHLGASSRAPAFHVDYQTKLSLRLLKGLHGMPVLWRLFTRVDDKYLADNERLSNEIRLQLQKDRKGFIARLRGKVHKHQ